MSRSCCGGGAPQKRPYRPFEPRRRRWLPFVVVALILVGGVALIVRPARVPPADTAARPTEEVQLQQGAAVPPPEDAASQDGPEQGAGFEVVRAEDGFVRLPVADLVANEARFYAYQTAEKAIPFFVLRSADGVIRVAFDACDVCYGARLGYHQEGDEMVCNNCGTRFPSSEINEVQGGCNPAPIDREVQGETITLTATDLEAGASFF